MVIALVRDSLFAGVVVSLVLALGCPSAPHLEDDGVHVGSRVSPAAVALHGECRRELLLGRHRIGIPNLESPTCRDEAAVFRREYGLELMSQDWTDAPGETLLVGQYPPLVPVDVFVWIPADDLGDFEQIATTDHCRAHQVYNAMRCGVTFRLTLRKQLTHYQGPSKPCTSIPSLKALGYQPGALNVYYGVSGRGEKGMNCAAAREIIYVTPAADYETLAHEIGHALGLGPTGQHVDDVTNIMASYDNSRKALAIGQCLRVNLSSKSLIHRYSSRFRDKQRDCPEENEAVDCPPRLWPDIELQQSLTLEPGMETTSGKPAVPPANPETAAIMAFLTCEECNAGERDRLLSFLRVSSTARETLCTRTRATLNPEAEEHLRESYITLAEYESTHPGARIGTPSFAIFRGFGLRAYQYRRYLRSILALQAVDEPPTETAACTAQTLFKELPEEVRLLVAKVVVF